MVYVASRVGKYHKECEDAVLVGGELLSGSSAVFEIPNEGFVCVADGVGGNKGGSTASRFVLDELAKSACNSTDLRELVMQINLRLIEKGEMDPELAGMATTLTGVQFRNGGIALIHVGNTRAYVRQGKYLKQVTSDHTTYNWLMSSGRPEEAATCNKNEITNCFGGGDPDYLSRLLLSEFHEFSLMVLTSDGVHEFVDLDSLEDMLTRNHPYEDVCESILDMAEANGSKDDMTIVIIAF